MDTNSKPLSPDRLKILKKIEYYEQNGIFDKDVEDDPPNKVLLPNKVDYLNKKLSSKVKTFIAKKIVNHLLIKAKKDNILIIKDVIGIENLQNLKSGAIITCNHFNPFDSFAMQECFLRLKQTKKIMYKVIREGNFTTFKGTLGYLMRHLNTLPLSSNRSTLKNFLTSVNSILTRGDFILIYPEQAMWWNYKKPRPLKTTAFKFAEKNNVPVLPIFITMSDSDLVGPDGFFIQIYTIHVNPPIYRDENKSYQENIEMMKNKNFEVWKNVYENTYGIPLTYLSKNLK